MADEEEEIVDKETGETVPAESTTVIQDLIEIPVGASKDLVALKEINKAILDDQEGKTRKSHSMLKKMYYVFKGRLWQSDENYGSLEDWLHDLYEAGIDYTSTSTFYEKAGMVDREMEIHGNLNRAITVAIKYDSLHKKMDDAGYIKIVKDGEGASADYTGTHLTEKGLEEFGGEEGYEKFSKIVSHLPRGARDKYVKTTLGIPSIHITDLKTWTEPIPFDIKKAPTLWGQVEIEDDQGRTPYNFVIIFEKGVTKAIVNGTGRRLKSNMRLLK